MKKNPDRDFYFKILVVGDRGAGKSNFVTRLRNGTFSEADIATIGVEFECKTIQIDGLTVKSVLWDTAGGMRFRAITQSFYRGCRGVIVVYDATDQSSFDSLEYWCSSIQKHTGNVPKVIVGTKCDLLEKRVVDYVTAKAFADEVKAPLLEVSAKTGINVEQAFVTLIASILEIELEGRGLRASKQLLFYYY